MAHHSDDLMICRVHWPLLCLTCYCLHLLSGWYMTLLETQAGFNGTDLFFMMYPGAMLLPFCCCWTDGHDRCHPHRCLFPQGDTSWYVPSWNFPDWILASCFCPLSFGDLKLTLPWCFAPGLSSLSFLHYYEERPDFILSQITPIWMVLLD